MSQVPPPPPPLQVAGGSASPPPPTLPAGWTEHWGPNNVPYYYNASTGVSTYARPYFAAGPPPPPPLGFDSPAAGAAADDIEQTQAAAPAKKEKKKKKEKPVEKLPIEGTPWLRVTTDQGNTFYTNTETKTSSWIVPEGLEEQVKQLEEELARKKNGPSAAELEERAAAARLLEEKEAEMQRLREELEGEREARRKRKAEEDEQERLAIEEEEQQAAKRAKLATVEDDDAVEHAGEDIDERDGVENGHARPEDEEEEEEEELEDWQKDELAAKKELEKELEEPAPSTSLTDFSSEEAVPLFKMMLSEKDINPMRPWDMELPKFINDERYRSVKTLRERRDLFDEHCKHLVREMRARKAAGAQAKEDPAMAYRALLTAEVKSTRMHWEDFRQKHKKDSRFRNFGRDDREREKAFKNWLRELGEIKRADAQKAEEKFVSLLKEKIIADGTRWSDVKGNLSSDPRYNAVASSSQREEVFNKYMTSRPKAASEAQIKDSIAEEEDRKKAAAEERKKRQEASLREREEKVRKDKFAVDRAAGRSRAEAGREGSVREYKTLLIDAVRDHQAKWNDAITTLEQDPRFTSSNLGMSEKRRLFDQHLDELYEKRIGGLESLFAQYAPKLTSSFEDVYASMSANPAVTRLDMSENRIGQMFEDWNKKRYAQARKDFDAMLSESTFVDYWGRLKQEHADKGDERAKELLGNENEGDEEMNVEDGVDLRAMAAQIDLKQLEAVLKHDKRYATFDHDPAAREQWIRDYIQRLEKPKQTVHQATR